MTLMHRFACRVRMVTALRVIGNCTLVLAFKELTSWPSDQAQIFSARLSAMVTLCHLDSVLWNVCGFAFSHRARYSNRKAAALRIWVSSAPSVMR